MTHLSQIQLAKILRDSSHNFVITEKNELDNDAYFTRLKCFIEALEGARNEAYLDGIVDPNNGSRFISVSKFNALSPEKRDNLKANCIKINQRLPIVTVGIGLNINKPETRTQYDELLGQPGLMQVVYEGKKNLTDEQVALVFKECIYEHLVKIREDYGSDWDKLRANERICIHSLYFNNPRLVNWKSNFRKNIRKYVETNDEKYLRLAVKEVSEKSNPKNSKGIQNRRDAEGILLASYDCPTFTKPCDDPASRFPKIVHLNDTVMPLGLRGTSQRQANAEYFIWRTRMDAKVRGDHLNREGKVFCKNDPDTFLLGTDYNCRCQSEEVPDHLIIMDQDIEQKAFDFYLRTGSDLSRLMNAERTP